MTARKPLVLVAGQLQELAAADSLSTALIAQVTSAFIVPGTTLADVPELIFTLKSGVTYSFEFELMLGQATATAIVGVGVNFTGTTSRLAYGVYLPGSASACKYQSTLTNNTAVVDAVARAVSTNLPARIAGSLSTTSVGVLSCRAQRSAATTTVQAGSRGVLVQG